MVDHRPGQTSEKNASTAAGGPPAAMASSSTWHQVAHESLARTAIEAEQRRFAEYGATEQMAVARATSTAMAAPPLDPTSRQGARPGPR